MVFRIFILIFCLEPTVRKGIWIRTICCCYSNLSAILIVTWSKLCLKLILNNYELHWQQDFEDFTDMDNICANSFLGNYHETKINESEWKN